MPKIRSFLGRQTQPRSVLGCVCDSLKRLGIGVKPVFRGHWSRRRPFRSACFIGAQNGFEDDVFLGSAKLCAPIPGLRQTCNIARCTRLLHLYLYHSNDHARSKKQIQEPGLLCVHTQKDQGQPRVDESVPNTKLTNLSIV